MNEAELKKTRDAGIAASTALREIEHAREVEENKKLVGKCYRYRNNYSCPDKPSDYWWSYTRIIGLDKDGDMIAFQFERDNHGEIRITEAKEMFRLVGGYKECDLDVFNRAWSELYGSLPKIPTTRRR